MGSPTKSLRTQASRSRFHEGSMNDKVSAVPPVHFLGPEERQALERPLELENQQYHQFQQFQQYQQRLLHPLQKAHSQIQIHLQTSSLSLSQAQTHSQHYHSHSHSHSHQKAPSVYRKGGNLIGQVWGGMRDKLKLRRDSNLPPDDFPKRREPPETTPSKRPDIDRPSREETLAAYQQLMASGFFTQHAIQSTRHARPGSIRPPCSRGSMAPSYMSAQQPDRPHRGVPPPWSFPPPRTPNAKKPCSPFATPVSTDSRGTKRAADENSIRIHLDRESDNDDDDDANDDFDDEKSLRNHKNNLHTNDDNDDGEDADNGEGEAPVRATTPHSKVRKIASKNFLPLPQLSVSGAKGKLLIARRMSSSASIGSGNLPPIIVQKKEPAGKLSKGAQASANASSPSPSPSRNSLDVLSGRRYSTPRRNVSESYYSVRAVGSGSMTSRTQRPREGEGLSVMPDANRGIPRVPLIPSKYATGYGDDGENRQMWRPNCHLIS